MDYSAAQLSDFAGGQPANGDVIEAHGTVNGFGVLVATRLEKRSTSLSGTTSDKAEVEGLVTRFASATDFDVAGQRATTTATTVYDGGTASTLALDVSVEVSGGFDSSGRIVAQKIEFRRESDLEISGNVDSFQCGRERVHRARPGRAHDESDALRGQEFRGPAALQPRRRARRRRRRSAWLPRRQHGRRDAGRAGGFRAGGGGSVEVKGPATAVSPPNFTVAGVLVTTDSQTEFRDKDGGSITAAAFFAAAPGREVKARGTLAGNTVLADMAELED